MITTCAVDVQLIHVNSSHTACLSRAAQAGRWELVVARQHARGCHIDPWVLVEKAAACTHVL